MGGTDRYSVTFPTFKRAAKYSSTARNPHFPSEQSSPCVLQAGQGREGASRSAQPLEGSNQHPPGITGHKLQEHPAVAPGTHPNTAPCSNFSTLCHCFYSVREVCEAEPQLCSFLAILNAPVVEESSSESRATATKPCQLWGALLKRVGLRL